MEFIDLLSIYRSKGIGPISFRFLVQNFSTKLQIKEYLHSKNRNIDFIDVSQELEIAEKNNIKYFNDIDNIHVPPIISYIGNINLLNSLIISIIGTRNPTEYGIDFCKHLLQQNKHITCSGLSRGIDTIVHIHSNHTIAVLPCGLLQCYPTQNEYLKSKIAKTGLLLSPFEPNATIQKHYFLIRNAIIADVCNALVLIEGTLGSGSLHAVDLAIKFDKKVFAVPGHPYMPSYEGNNMLLKQNSAEMLLNFKDLSFSTVIKEKAVISEEMALKEMDDISLDV